MPLAAFAPGYRRGYADAIITHYAAIISDITLIDAITLRLHYIDAS